MQRLFRIYLLIFLWILPVIAVSQEETEPFFAVPARLQIGFNSHIYQFKGDESHQPFSASRINPGFELALEQKSWRFSVPLSYGAIFWNNNGPDTLNNFNTRFWVTGLNAQFRLLKEQRKLSPFIGIGYNLVFFNVYQDLKNSANQSYNLWSDGKIRNLPQSPENEDQAMLISRDYEYETTVLRNQRITCFPLSIGMNSALNDQLRLSLSYSMLLLQGDNFDNSLSKTGWDKLSSISIGLSWTIPPSKRLISPGKPAENQIDYSQVDFAALFNADEDGDGVSDALDKCYGTPKGAPVDAHGCTADSDEDGIPDFLDQEPNSIPNSRIHPTGVAWSDEEYIQFANDSLSYFVNTLRKTNKNSRPYPVRKHIPSSAYMRWSELLEQNPDWVRQRSYVAESIPAEFKIFDLNGDGFLSLLEMEQAVIDMFELRSNGISEALIRKAIEYAFRNQ